MTGDLNENETALKFAFNLYSLSKIFLTMFILNFIAPEKVQPYMQQITLTCLKVLIDEKCDEISESFKFEVGKFIKNIIMTQNLPML